MALADKLQVKPGERVWVVGEPEGFDLGEDVVRSAHPSAADAVVVFVRTAAELSSAAAPALEAARQDRLSWVAYPKAGQLSTDLNRDSLAAAMIDAGVRPVRQIAIDDVWSALRFRPG